MNNLNLFEPFEFYRETSKMQFFEDPRKHKKHTLVSILAPSIEEEFKYIKTTQDIVFRYLNKYFVDKFQNYVMYPNKRHRDIIEEEDIKKLYDISLMTNKNFDDIDIIINNPRAKTDLVKGKNCLFEINYILEKMLNNDKDKRSVKLQKDDIIMELEKSLKKSSLKFGPEYRKVLIIPIHLWLDFDQYRDTNTFNARSNNMISHIYNYLSEDIENAFIFDGWDILLTNHNEVMILNMDTYLNNVKSMRRDTKRKNKYDTLESYIRYFMKHCLTKSDQEKVSPDEKDLSINKDMYLIKEKSEAKRHTEKIIADSGLKKDNIPEDKIEEIEELVIKKIHESGDLSKVKIKETKDPSVIADVIAASLSKQSRDSYARNKMLKEKYGNTIINREGSQLKLQDVPDEIKAIPIKEKVLPINVINKDLKTIRTSNFAETYNEELFDYDLAAIIGHFAKCDPAMYPITDLEEEDVSEELNRLLRYSITFEDSNRKRHNLKFLLPKFYQEKYLFLNGSVKYITHQKIAFPITKIKEDVVQLGSNYNKIFINRSGQKVSPKIVKLTKYLNNVKNPKIMAIRGDASKSSDQILTTVEYDELIRTFTELRIDSTTIYLDLVKAVTEIGFYSNDKMDKIDELPLPLAKSGSKKYYLDAKENLVIDNKGVSYGQLSDFIIGLLEKIVGEDALSDITMGKRFIYSEADIMNERIPVILLACTMAPGGLVEILDTAKIKYEFYPNKSTVKHDKLNRGSLKFSDGVLLYDLYPYENSLLLNGLQGIPTREYTFLEFSSRETFIDIYDIIFGRRNLIEAIENFRQLFMDPITKQVSLKLNLPLDIIKIVLYGSDLLADNNFISDVQYHNSRVRKNEIVLVYLYKILSTQYGKYRMNPDKVKFTIPEDAVIKEIISSRLVDEYSKMNQPLAVEMDQEIKGKGPFGLNVDQAYTLDRRAYEDSMLGIVGSATAPSGEVGVKRHLALGANITDARGFVNSEKVASNLSGTELLTPGEMLNVFSNEKSDATRAAMSINQAKQILPTVRTTPDILSYGMDRVVPYITDAFSRVAKQDGKVIEISDDIMIVQYKDGTYDDIDLANTPVKHTNSAKHFTSNKVTDLKEGKSFKSGDILVYDPNQIKSPDILGDHVATTGVLARVAYLSTGETYEDSKYISQKLADDLSSDISKEKTLIISRFSTIHSMVKIGDKVKAGQPLIIFDDTGDEVASEMSKINREQKEIFKELSNTSFKTDISGEIVGVKIFYGVAEEDLSDSIKKVAKSIQSKSSKRKKLLKKYDLVNKGNVLLEPDSTSAMDSSGRIKGVKVDDKVLIEFIIQYRDVVSSGDKLTLTSAVKGINSYVVPNHLAAYPVSDPSFKIDAYVSTLGIVKRMAHDINGLSAGGKIVYDHQNNMAKKYGEAVKRELSRK